MKDVNYVDVTMFYYFFYTWDYKEKKTMKTYLKIVKAVSVLSIIALASILLISCGGGEENILPPSALTKFTIPEVWAIAIDASGGKWFGTYEDGVYYLDDNGTPTNKTDDTWATFTNSDGLTSNRIRAIVTDASGGKWFGTNDGGVCYLDDKGTPTNKTDDIWVIFKPADGLASWYIDAVAIDTSGAKWILTSGGLSYFDDNGTPTNKTDDTWVTFTTADGIPPSGLESIAIDATGGKWFGSWGGGVSYFDDNGTPTNKTDDLWVTFTTSDGLANNDVREIAVDTSGAKWIGTQGDGSGVNYFDDNGTPTNKTDDTWVTFTTADGLTSNGVEAVVIDGSGGKWFGSWGGNGVSYFDDKGTPADKSDDNWIIYGNGLTMAIAIDASGGKWFGGAEGASYLR